MADQDPIQALTAQLDELTGKSTALLESMANAPTSEEYAKQKAELEGLQAKMGAIDAEREKQAQAAEVVRLRQEIDRLNAQRTERKYQFNVIGAPREVVTPFPKLLWLAKRGNVDALRQLGAIETKTADMYGFESKALAEGTASAGGYLVPPEYIQDLVLLRRATAPLLSYVRPVPVTSNLVYVPQQTTVSTVGWTAENATKPSTDEVFNQLSANIYTLAGIAKVSKQMLEDSAPAVDAIVRQDIMRGLNIEMDRVMINGSGTGQPTGILNVSGIDNSVTSTATSTHPEYLLNDIIKAIALIQQNYFGQPDAIVMSPRTWGALMASKDTTGRFLLLPLTSGAQDYNAPGYPVPTGATADNQGITGGMVYTFAGIPIVVDANMPINLSGSNSAVIVGAFREAWWLKRDDVRMDVSSEAGTSWETNQTWFRGELRMGFTAARLTNAFEIIPSVVI